MLKALVSRDNMGGRRRNTSVDTRAARIMAYEIEGVCACHLEQHEIPVACCNDPHPSNLSGSFFG